MPREVVADPTAVVYATPDEADVVASARQVTAWQNLGGVTEKMAFLLAATLDIDTLAWIGSRETNEQELEWPRVGTEYTAGYIPWLVKAAVIEQAFALAAGDTTLNPSATGGNLKRIKAGPAEEEYFARTNTPIDLLGIARFPSIVQNLLRRLVRIAPTAAPLPGIETVNPVIGTLGVSTDVQW